MCFCLNALHSYAILICKNNKITSLIGVGIEAVYHEGREVNKNTIQCARVPSIYTILTKWLPMTFPESQRESLRQEIEQRIGINLQNNETAMLEICDILSRYSTLNMHFL